MKQFTSAASMKRANAFGEYPEACTRGEKSGYAQVVDF
jgi:hypothetical protein